MAFDPGLFASTALAIGIAELPDKTALATILLATRGNPWAVFIGVAAAFVIQSLVAVLAGGLLSLAPHHDVQIASGVLFLVYAVLMWFRKDGKDEKVEGSEATFWAAVGTAFMVIFIAEWGDLTQFAAATLAARSGKPLTILLASILALWSVSALAIIAGNRLGSLIHPRLIQRLAAVLFAGIGILMLTGIAGF
jgi:putative Ca2+/H+ antiporter (TMEM165/GDT1 family)